MDSKINSSKSTLSKHLSDSVKLASSLHWLLKLVEANFDLLDQVMFLLRPGSHVVVHSQTVLFPEHVFFGFVFSLKRRVKFCFVPLLLS